MNYSTNKFLFKILGINLLIFLVYSTIIEFLTHDDWEGFGHTIYYVSLVGMQVLVNLILTIIAATRKKPNLKHYLFGLFLTFAIAIVTYIMLD